MTALRTATLRLVFAPWLLASAAAAQTPAHDPSSTLEQVLPPDVAEQVLARIADARSKGLPAAALEHRALELHAKGAPPADIARAVDQTAEAMEKGKKALVKGGRAAPDDAEVGAAGEAVAKGVDGSGISELAKSAPSGRSLAVPLAVVANLIDRGLPADDALQQVRDRLEARASDQELADLPAQADAGQAHRPAATGHDAAGSHRPPAADGRATQRPMPMPAPASPSPPRGGGRR